MNDTEILDWLESNASKLGIKPDISAWSEGETFELDKPQIEHTNIRQRVMKLASESVAHGLKVGDKWGAYWLHADGMMRLFPPNVPGQPRGASRVGCDGLVGPSKDKVSII